MEIKQYVLAVFSPTGGTLKIARAICKGTGLAGTEVDLCTEPEPREIGPDTLLVAAMPVYENRIREVALRRLSRLRGKNGPAVAVVVYGNRDYGDALPELSDTLQESVQSPTAGNLFVSRPVPGAATSAYDLRCQRQPDPPPGRGPAGMCSVLPQSLPRLCGALRGIQKGPETIRFQAPFLLCSGFQSCRGRRRAALAVIPRWRRPLLCGGWSPRGDAAARRPTKVSASRPPH